MIRTTAEALALLRRHDAAKLYETLDAWQQRELLCVVRRIADDIHTKRSPHATVQ